LPRSNLAALPIYCDAHLRLRLERRCVVTVSNSERTRSHDPATLAEHLMRTSVSLLYAMRQPNLLVSSERRAVAHVRCAARGFIFAAALMACGKSDVTTDPIAAAASAANAGSGATGSEVKCGSSLCRAPSIPAGVPVPAPVACCADEEQSLCGNLIGAMCTARPAPAPKCPLIPPFGSPTLLTAATCCQSNNVCGVDASAFGAGCASTDTVARLGAILPPPTLCDGTPIASGTSIAGAAASAASLLDGAAGGGG
jgi:hypothetical protein